MVPASEKVFLDCLRRKGLKITKPRARILEALYRVGGHVSAEDLHKAIQKKGASVGVATVYRTLKILTECGLAQEVRFRDGTSRFEPDLGRHHHDHMICTGCGRTLEFMNPTIEALQEKVAKKHGFTISHHRMNLYGVCQECRAKKAGAKKGP